MLGDDVWEALDLTARTTLADAERSFRDHRDDHGYDFASVVVGFAKAIEVQCNAVLRRAAALLKPAERTANVEGGSVDLSKSHGLSLGQLARVIAGDKDRFEAIRKALHNGVWFTEQLPPILEELRELRNPAAHTSRVSRDQATRWRNRILGVGGTGVIVELARCTPRTR